MKGIQGTSRRVATATGRGVILWLCLAGRPGAAWGGPERVQMEFADGRISCEIVPAGSPVPDMVISTLPVAMRIAVEHLGPPPRAEHLTIRLQKPPSFYKRALSLFRVEALATQQGDEILLQPGTDPLRLAFRLGHELSHWLVYKHDPARPPLWLDEGLANWIGAAVAEAMARPLRQTVERPVPHPILPHLYSLDELIALTAYPRTPERIGAFYWQAEALVTSLKKQLGPVAFRVYLELLSAPDAPAWDAPLRERWYFTDGDFERFANQIRP